jgi:nickel/cobalt exporter
MGALLTGSMLLSIFHALIPSHWLPVIAISRQQHWTRAQTLRVTLLAGAMHVLSTVLVGLSVAFAGHLLSARMEAFTAWIAPSLLSLLGIVFIYRHYYHHHLHIQAPVNGRSVILTLALAMFFSPCLEIEAYFLAAGSFGWAIIGLVAAMYAVVTLTGMLLWVWLVLGGLQRLDWHKLEHNAGLITGVTMVASGLLLYFFD